MTASPATPAPPRSPLPRGRMAPLLNRPVGWQGLTFLAINLLVFIAVNAFWRHISTGGWADMSPGSYLEDLRTPLGTALREPLGVVQRPWMIAVASGLLGGMVFVPLIVAVLYPLWGAVAFLLVVALVGHCPGMAIALGIGCLLAARTPLRGDVPFIAILLGLLPAALYMYFFAFAGTNLASLKPIHRLLVCVPFLSAFALAIVGAAIVLALAQWSGYRPGVLSPVLAILLAVPVTIFYQKVGADELRYALIVGALGPGDALFPEEPLSDWQSRTAHQGLAGQALAEDVEGELDARRRRLIGRCEDFLDRYPKSSRAPEVLWVQAQAYSARLLGGQLARGVIQFSAAWPLEASRGCWQRLADQYPQTPPAALARWRLLQLSARSGNLQALRSPAAQAAEALDAVAGRLASTRGPFGEPRAAVPGIDHFHDAVAQARELADLIDLHASRLPLLGEYLRCDPDEPGDLRRRGELAQQLRAAATGPAATQPASATRPGSAPALP